MTSLTTIRVLEIASEHMKRLASHEFDVLSIAKPVSVNAALNLAKIVSKLSPLIGNLIEINTCEFLSDQPEFRGVGKWVRQDPGFPDAIFQGNVQPVPGFEIKAWFPLATEITARFKDSQNHFQDDRINLVVLAWLPGFLIYGRPVILDVLTTSGASVAKARDDHYHNPPDYLVLEPEDTKARTRNLQQTNTNGYKWQGTRDEFRKAEQVVANWGIEGRVYSPTPEYQAKLRELTSQFSYRLDTNYAKIDRIAHRDIEAFKARVLRSKINNLSVAEWSRLLSSGNEATIRNAFARNLDIIEADAGKLLK